MNLTKYLSVGSMAAIKVRDHPHMTYGTTVSIKRMHGNIITVTPSGSDKVYYVNANILHNSLMPYT